MANFMCTSGDGFIIIVIDTRCALYVETRKIRTLERAYHGVHINLWSGDQDLSYTRHSRRLHIRVCVHGQHTTSSSRVFMAR